MNISLEISILIISQLITIGIFVGKLHGFQKIVEYRLSIMEGKQEKHNNFVERLISVENSAKAMHKRLDYLDNFRTKRKEDQ